MSQGNSTGVVDWDAPERRRRRLEVELARIVAELPRLHIKQAIVFGSFARGQVGAASDLDLILIVETDTPFGPRNDECYRALVPAVGVDLFVYTPEEIRAMRDRAFLRRALAEGVVVYEA
jgi:predicted nucleotidyltransferase